MIEDRRIGPYELRGLIGAGGMGEVYLARDTKLGRDVAIKVLPPGVAHDAERIRRFEREARTLASLNHPHIAHIYGVEDAGGTSALVMEYVEGPTLADRLSSGPLPLDEALPMARQMAEALEYAHDCGIVHRDFKPANVKLRPDGSVKVLDFGLAKALGTDTPPPRETSRLLRRAHGALHRIPPDVSAGSDSGPSDADTTRFGTVLGTTSYMPPEQARGRQVDRRADIWAFGCVLFEMLTARRAFIGPQASDALNAALSTHEHDLVPAGRYSAAAAAVDAALPRARLAPAFARHRRGACRPRGSDRRRGGSRVIRTLTRPIELASASPRRHR